MLWKLLAFLHARHHLAFTPPRKQARQLAFELISLSAVDGAVWGALGWAALGQEMGNAAILVLAVSAGAAGGAVSQMSPILPVFVAFIFTELTAVLSKVWALHDPFYNALGLASIVYVAHLFVQARNNSTAIQRTIELRFENAELLNQLRVEKAIAETSQREARPGAVSGGAFAHLAERTSTSVARQCTFCFRGFK
jgi:hypothetical protein